MSSSYKYSININQQAALELGLNVDIIDLAIFDFIKDFVNSKKCVRTQTDEGVFFWVSHKTIIEQLPLINITTPRGIAKRVENLINAGLLKKYSKCDELSRTLYTFGEKYDEYHFVRTPEQKFQGGGTKVQGIINITDNSNNSPITDSPTMNSSPINSPIITLEESRITSNTPKENDQPTIFGDKIPQEKVLDENEVIRSIMGYWNTETKFIKIRNIEGKRRKMLIARLKEEGANNVIKAIQTANQSSFLTEKWKMTFDWFVMPSNFTKIVEGNYNNDYGDHTSRPTDSQLLGAAIRNSWGPDGNPFD